MYKRLLVMLATAAAIAKGDAIVSVSTSAAFPLTSYSYTVAASGPENVFEFTLFLEGPVLTASILSPPGWTTSSSPTFIDWFAIDDTQQVAAGGSLGGFGFDSFFGPGDATFVTLGFTQLGDPIVTSDTTVGPASVPEPDTRCLLLLALPFLIWRRLATSKD